MNPGRSPLAFILLLALLLCGLAAPAEMIRDVEYAHPDEASLKLDVNVPEGKGPFPIAILVHGGGFTNADKQSFPPQLFKPFTDAKYTWFNISHRGLLSNSYPAWVEDVKESVHWVKAHAAEYKGDPRRVALIGESFGAYIALLAAGQATNDRPDAVVAFYPPFADLTRSIHDGHVSATLKKIYGIQTDEDAPKILREASTVTYLAAGFPPLLIVHGTADEKVPYAASVDAWKLLSAAGVPCELISVTNAPHGMSGWDTFDQSYKSRMIAWLNHTLGPTGRH